MSLASPEKQPIPVVLRASSPHINGLGVLSCLAKKTNSDRWIVRPALALFGITSVTTNWLSQSYFWYIHWSCPKKGSPQSDTMWIYFYLYFAINILKFKAFQFPLLNILLRRNSSPKRSLNLLRSFTRNPTRTRTRIQTWTYPTLQKRKINTRGNINIVMQIDLISGLHK